MSTAAISTETWHGTCRGYNYHHCRCDACKTAAADYRRAYYEAIRSGQRQLPDLDWAVCARGGSAAQAKAHRRRGQKPCPACFRAEAAAKRNRKASL